MRIGQVLLNGDLSTAIFQNEKPRAVPGRTVLQVLSDPTLAASASSVDGAWEPALPIHPPEVWGCGCTYETSASFRDAEHGTREGMYAYVYRESRPEVFFKGTARVCTGPGQPIGIRPDSKFTAPEPELALILDSRGHIVGYTLANDVSAWDIERENPLYLPQ